MTLAQIVRYPVKSMRGESLPQAEVTPHGLAQDRLYAFESEAAPPGMLRLAGRERRELLRYTARSTPAGVQVMTPDGETVPVAGVTFPEFSATRLTLEPTPQTDVRPLALISLQTIGALSQELGQVLDPRRFRANLYLDLAAPFLEDTWAGEIVRVGEEVRLQVLERTPRCRFITLDPETTDPLPGLMKLLDRSHGGRAGVYARVLTPGTIMPGDPIALVG